MEDYNFSENSNDKSSSKEFSANVSSERYTSSPSNTGSNYQNKIQTMPDDVLSEKLPFLTQTVDTNEEQAAPSNDEGISTVNVGNGIISDALTPDTEQAESCATVPSVHLSAYNTSEPSLNVINSNAPSNLWSNSVEENVQYNLNTAVNGAITFTNYSNPDVLYEANIINQTPNLSSQMQRRSYTTGNFSHPSGNIPQINNQQNIFVQNKNFSGNWSNSRNVWPPSMNSQSNINSLSNWRGRSVPNLNPVHNLNGRKLNNPHLMQQHLVPVKFRRSTSFPGKPMFNQASYDISNDDNELLFQQYQDPTVLNNGNSFVSASPLDTMGTLHQCLNDAIRPSVDVTADTVNTSANNAVVIGNGNIVGANGTADMIVGKNSGYLNVNLMHSLNLPDRTTYYTGFDEQVANSLIENPVGATSHIVDGQIYLQSLNHPNLADKEEKFSRKVFVGGLPPDIDEEEISASFRRFGPLVVDWPHKAESKSYFPPKGYAFLLFQDEMSVQQLIDSCIQEEDKLYLVVSSPTVKDKAVQIRPWKLTDADFVLNASMPLDPRKTVFVGGVPRPLKAFELATIMDRLYGCVCYAGIDTDPELKYPKGAGRVAFSSQHSYISAISARFVQLQHGEIDKRVEVKPYVLDDQMCDECAGQFCGGKFAPFFCANVMCLQYYCDHCWNRIHSRSGREYHKPLVKEGADRPRATLQQQQQQQYRWC